MLARIDVSRTRIGQPRPNYKNLCQIYLLTALLQATVQVAAWCAVIGGGTNACLGGEPPQRGRNDAALRFKCYNSQASNQRRRDFLEMGQHGRCADCAPAWPRCCFPGNDLCECLSPVVSNGPVDMM